MYGTYFHDWSRCQFWVHFLDFCVQNQRYFPWSSTHFGSSLPALFTEKVLGAISRVVHPKTKRFAVKFRRILEVLPCNVYKKSSGRIFSIFASKSEAVCRWVQMHSGCSLLAMLTVKSSGHNFTIYVSKNEAVCCWVQTHFGSFCLASLIKKFWMHLLDFCVQNEGVRCEAQTHFGSSLPARFTEKSSGHNVMICVQKRSSFLWNSGASWTFLPCKGHRKSSGRIVSIFSSKNDAVCCEVQTHFWGFCLACFI